MNAPRTKFIRNLFVNKSEKKLHVARKSFSLDSHSTKECLYGAGDLSRLSGFFPL